MKVIKCNDFNSEFPEAYNWGRIIYWERIDSYHLYEIAEEISENIKYDLKTDDRNLTPGLRHALRIIAERAEVY